MPTAAARARALARSGYRGPRATARGDEERVAGVLAKAPADRLVEQLLPQLWLTLADGFPANVCVDACVTLRFAFGQFGIESLLQPVDLTIKDTSGAVVVHGSPQPSWNAAGTEFTGHCVLWLPGSSRLIDPTVDQYERMRRLGLGPLVARSVASTTPTAGGRPVPGTLIAGQRRDLTVLYTTVASEWTDSVEHPRILEHREEHRRAGINLASLALAGLRDPQTIERARATEHPRLHALLDAAGDAPFDLGEDRDFRFTLTDGQGETRRLRLDELPLPADIPPAYPPSDVAG
jgi:hypothetical protein